MFRVGLAGTEAVVLKRKLQLERTPCGGSQSEIEWREKETGGSTQEKPQEQANERKRTCKTRKRNRKRKRQRNRRKTDTNRNRQKNSCGSQIRWVVVLGVLVTCT